MRLALLAALLAALAACASQPSAAPASGPYGQLYALEGHVASDLAEGKLTGAHAIVLNTALREAKALLDAGLDAQGQAQLTAAASELAVDLKEASK
ncbi:MAG: hypothetical protein ACRDF8_00775 [Chloroflexota bacterium]